MMNFVSTMMNLALRMMEFVSKMLSFALKMMNLASNMMDSVLKMINFALKMKIPFDRKCIGVIPGVTVNAIERVSKQ